MKVTDYVARQTERMAEAMAHFVATTPEDRLVWHPQVEGSAPTRSILEQAGECVAVNRTFAAVLRRGPVETSNGGMLEVKLANGQDAQEQLVISARELAQAIRGLSDDDLQKRFTHPRGEFLGENLIMSPLRNMAYHAGQLNLIQMLYGDAEFHVPATWR